MSTLKENIAAYETMQERFRIGLFWEVGRFP